MKVLVTGAAGVLGKAVTALLEDEPGVELRLTDMAPLETPHEFIQADLSRAEEVEPLCDGVDEVMHIASIHPWKEYAAGQYIDCNIKGTHHVLAAAAAGAVRRVILTSSIAAMGMGRDEAFPLPWDETKPCVPGGSLYALTKHMGEQLCDLFRARGAFKTVVLRPGTFIPRPDDDPVYGLGLLGAWLHPSDVAQAHLLALRSDVENEAFIIAAKAPFTRDDGEALLTDARSVILRHYPQAAELERRGIALPKAIACCYDISKAERLLGYRPKHTFDSWLRSMLRLQVES